MMWMVRCGELHSKSWQGRKKLLKERLKQGNRWSHFARTVHSYHSLPGRSHLQQMPQRQNDPFCCVTLLATEWSFCSEHITMHCQWGKKHKTVPSPWDFVTLPKEDRATAMGNMRRKAGKDCACGSRDILTDRQTDMLITILHNRSHRQSSAVYST